MTQRDVHLVSTTVQPATCPRCRRQILVALDEGLPARVDPAPITPAEEIAALLTGRWTYTRTRQGDLIHRDAGRIRGHPPGDIHIEHRCEKPRQASLWEAP